jgi:hypothetical protein
MQDSYKIDLHCSDSTKIWHIPREVAIKSKRLKEEIEAKELYSNVQNLIIEKPNDCEQGLPIVSVYVISCWIGHTIHERIHCI